jgi:hypothetical protein
MKNIKYISIIIPISGIDNNIISYRDKYNRFASYGIPPHISFIYNIPMETYKKKKKEIIKILTKSLHIMNKYETKVDHFIKNKTMLALGLNKELVELINKLQHMIIKYLDIKNTKYDDSKFLPHITIFTGYKNPGWKDNNKIVKTIKKHVPFLIKINKIRIMEINPKKNIAKLIKILQIV